MKLVLTPTQAYLRKQRIWKLYCEWSATVRRAFFPDTAGVSLYMHNWYLCGEDKVKRELAEWIEATTYARQQRLYTKMEAREVEREHNAHSTDPHFNPLWCPICHPKQANP